MGKVVLIGGGDIGKNGKYETKIIDKKIVEICNKKEPIMLFVGLASSYSDSYYDMIKKIYQDLGCKTTYLKRKNLINNPDIVDKKIEDADIIYIGGGDTIKLIEDVYEFQLDKKLRNAYQRGTILVGMSAGAILLSKEGFSDSYILRNESTHYKFLKGLNIIHISICPHFDLNSMKEEELKKNLNQRRKMVYALENKTALLIEDNQIDVIKTKEEHIYLCYNKDSKYQIEEYKKEVK